MRTIRSQIKNNPWPYVNLAKLVHNARMGDGEVIELLRITNGYLPRVRLEYDRVKNELNAWKAELGNTVRIYQQFVDRNLELKRREVEHQRNIDKMENKKAELQKTTTELRQHLADFQENNTYRDSLNPVVKRENIISTNDVFIASPNMASIIIRIKMKCCITIPKLSHHLGH
ncbi:MAG: hypothetical protein WBL67_15925 [Nitrososphaeraceae archaeon]